MKTLLMSVVIATAAAAACKKKEQTEETPQKKIEPVSSAMSSQTQQKKVAPKIAFDTCWKAFNSKDEAGLRNCYDANSNWTMIDAFPPQAGTGVESAIAAAKALWTAFPDYNASPQLILQNGNNFALILLSKGTNSGTFMGMPASNKKLSIFEGNLTSYNEQGKVKEAKYFADHSVVAHQLGMFVNPMAPDAEQPWIKTESVVAKNDETERANVTLIKSTAKMLEAGDHEAYKKLLADNVSFRYAGQKMAVNDKASYIKAFEQWIGMADVQGEITTIWGAGDWVVSVTDATYTLKQDFPGAPDTKGKTVKLKMLEFTKVESGKITQHWVFENGMAYAAQLGLLPSSGTSGKATNDGASIETPKKK